MPYERIPYKSFLWKLGTTSFRTKEFNRKTELQLRLLDEFWHKPEYSNFGWEKKYMFPGQKDIYWIKNRYYDWLVENEFMEGGESEEIKYKTAREKTSGLYDMGFLNENHRITPVGYELMRITESQAYLEKTELGISKDSLIYLEQLLKLSSKDTGTIVRPIIIVFYLLSHLGYLSNDEFKYLMPLCTDEFSTSYIINCIEDLRDGKGSIDDIIVDFLMNKPNYQNGLSRFIRNDFSEDLLLSVGMNRKSAKYDKPYTALYNELHSVYIDKNYSRIYFLFNSLKEFQSSIGIKWKQMLFDTSITRAVRNKPIDHLLPLPESVTSTEENFKIFFFKTMHLNKAKATLEDYQDLNRRYLGLTNCFIFEDSKVLIDLVPKQVFGSAINVLYEQAYQESNLLESRSSLSEICPALTFNERKVIEGINHDLGTRISTIEEAYSEVDKIRYSRFNNLLEEKFDTQKLLYLLDCFDSRNDEEINKVVTDNADIPTIFEYILGIIWYKVSEKKGKILDYLKLSLDANLLPITHAAGGEADIVYEYKETTEYPEHSLLLEATLADSTNQRRMEMEPVSRHLGNHLVRTHNLNSYCVFATSFLHKNVISDFRGRKNAMYFDPLDDDNFVNGMKIIPLCTKDLRLIVMYHITYDALYKRFDFAHSCEEKHPLIWYNKYIKIEDSSLYEPIEGRKLVSVEDDQDVRNLIFDRLHLNPNTNILELQREIQEIFGEKYSGMKANDWRHIIEEYTPSVRESAKKRSYHIINRQAAENSFEQ